MSIIFYHNEAQKELAIASRDRLQAEAGRPVLTVIAPAGRFYPAEDYHQKYYLQSLPPLEDEFRAIYPDMKDFVNSTAVARVNGYAGGYGTAEALQEENKLFGLSPAGVDKVLELAARGLEPACPAP